MSNDPYSPSASMSGTGYSASYGNNQLSGQAPDAAAPAAKKSPTIKDTSTAEFAVDVIEASNNQIVLVDFWANWCGPCKQLGPILENVVEASNGKAVLVKMDIDKHPEVAGQMGIKSIPAVVAFVDGKPVDAFMGAIPESEIRTFIDKQPAPVNPAPAEEDSVETLMAKADKLLNKGDSVQAAEILAAILAKEPGNLDAIAGMGECYLAVGELELAQNIVASLPEEQLATPVIVSFLAKLKLVKQTAALGSLDDLEKKVQDNPNDHQARFDFALALNAHDRRDEAASQLLEIFSKDRKWKDDGAREQLLQFFDMWGPMDPATLTGRRGLSSILFS